MEYEIKLSGTTFDDGAIDLDRLELLAQSIRDIAKGALQIRLLGTSAKRGRDSAQLTNALRIRLRGIKPGSTVLQLECEPFRNTLKGVPGNLFRQEIFNKLPDQSPVGLVMEAFREAINPEDEHDLLLDKPLLQDLQKFKRVFINPTQILEFSNRGSQPDLRLTTNDLLKIKQVEEQIPNPQPVIITGLVEELKFSKAKVTFIPDQGAAITGFLGENVPAAEMAKYWGEKVTIRGTAHFRPSGRMAHVEIAQVALAHNDDAYFSRPVLKETVAQQIERQIREKGTRNRLSEFIGILADAEGTFENDLKILNQ